MYAFEEIHFLMMSRTSPGLACSRCSQTRRRMQPKRLSYCCSAYSPLCSEGSDGGVQARNCRRILELMHAGALMLDEVDMILHPLKSELNWPLGAKLPLDFTYGAEVCSFQRSSIVPRMLLRLPLRLDHVSVVSLRASIQNTRAKETTCYLYQYQYDVFQVAMNS